MLNFLFFMQAGLQNLVRVSFRFSSVNVIPRSPPVIISTLKHNLNFQKPSQHVIEKGRLTETDQN